MLPTIYVKEICLVTQNMSNRKKVSYASLVWKNVNALFSRFCVLAFFFFFRSTCLNRLIDLWGVIKEHNGK